MAQEDREVHSNFEYVNLILINIAFLRLVPKNRVKISEKEWQHVIQTAQDVG